MALANRLYIILLVCLGCLHVVPVRAGVAPWVMEFLDRYRIPLRWDNVEGNPVWISGAEPRYSADHRCHIFTLHPGDEVTIRIPAHALIRLADPVNVLDRRSLQAFVSGGAGLFLQRPFSLGEDDHSLLVQPGLRDNGLFRLANVAMAEEPVQVALFVSRYDAPTEPAPYRHLLEFSAPTVNVKEKPIDAGRAFQRLSADRPSQIRVKGPLRLLLEHRLIFPSAEPIRYTPYLIKGLLDTRNFLSLSSATMPDSRTLLEVDGQYPVLGHLRKSYFSVPEGEHVLTFIPGRDLLVRLTARNEPDYLFPALNNPFVLDDHEDKKNDDPIILFARSKEAVDVLQPELSELIDVEGKARRVWRNNQYPDGGLSAAMALRQVAEQYPGASDLQKESDRVEAAYTFYRDVFPEGLGAALNQTFSGVISPRLQEDGVQLRVIQENALPAVVDSMERAYFADMPSIHGDGQETDAPSLTYLLPHRRVPSELRILVEVANQSGSFMVKVGNNPEIQCDILPRLIRPPEEFELDTTMAAVQLPQDLIRRYFFLSPEIDPLGRWSGVAYVAEVTVPLDVASEKVVLRPLKTGESPLRVALQYRDSSPFILAEPEYLQAEKSLGRDITAYQVALKMLSRTRAEPGQQIEDHEEGIGEIEAFLRPLIRYIHTRDIVFSSSVASLPAEPETDELSAVAIAALRTRIKTGIEAGQWISVLENAVELYQGSRGQNTTYAAMLIIDALENSGESYLAEIRLRGMLLYPREGEANLAEMALMRLERQYLDRNDLTSLSSLYAACFSRNPSPALLGKLAGVLLQEGRYRLALSASIILPPAEQHRETLLLATLKSGWQRIFQATVDAIPAAEEQNYWRGLAQEKLGATEVAQDFFAAAGAGGKHRFRTVEKARAIGARLTHPDLQERQQAIFSWEQWQAQVSGPYVWRSEPWLVYDHAGGVFVYSEAQDEKMVMFQATGNRPVQARIWGPATIKFVLRPLHDRSINESLTGWAFLRTGNELELIPINNNQPVQQWVMPPVAKTVPGRAVTYERSFGPGPHDISISSETLPLLVGLQVHRPLFQYGLPPLSHGAVNILLKDVAQEKDQLQGSGLGCLLDDCLAVVSRDPIEKPQYFPAIRFTVQRKQQSALSENQAKDRIIQLQTARSQQRVTSVDRGNGSGGASRLIASGQWEEALAALGEKTAVDRFRLMALLTYLAEIRPAQRGRYEARARRLVQAHPAEYELQPLLQRISAQTQWQKVEQLQGGGGLRLVPVLNWLPENPSLRIRKALLTIPFDNHEILTNEDPLVLSLDNPLATELEITWRLSEVSYLQPEEMDLFYQLDDQEKRTLTLSPDQPRQSVRIIVPPGRHRLVTAIKSRYGNQFVQVRFQEVIPTSRVPLEAITWLPQVRERAYHVVTGDQPLHAMVLGPAWVRMDELRQGETFSRYRYVKQGWQTIEILPEKKQEEMLVRLYRRVEKSREENAGLSRETIRTYPQLPAPLLALGDEKKPGAMVGFVDNYRLGRQEDGTWSASLSWNKRRDVDEDTENEEGETFVQLSGTYHRLYDSMPTYLKSSLFVRKRTLGGPTIGLSGDITRRFNQLPVTFRFEGEGLIQNPEAGETAILDQNPSEWSVRFAASAYQYRYINPKIVHRPMLSVFGRLLSLDDGAGYAPDTIDQDIFTVYKSDHPSGLRFSEYLNYRPWLDTALIARGSYTTNSDMNPFNPDNIRLSAGFGQLIGPARVDFRYQFSHFFDDENRAHKIDRNDLFLGLSWDYWFADQSRLQLGMRAQYRLDSDDFTGMAGLTWYFSAGRAMRDLRPEDDLFYTIKSNRASQLMNNKVSDAEVCP